MKQNLELSVSSCGSAADRWKDKPKRPLISKIIKRDQGDFAIILTEDSSKSMRFLYLMMLLGSKTGIANLNRILKKLETILLKQEDFQFQDMTLEMKKIGKSIASILKELKVLRKKMEGFQKDNLAILKIIHEYDIVDPLLVLALRGIATSPQLGIKNSLNCFSALGLNQVDKILQYFGNQKFAISSKNNRFVIFLDLAEIQCEFFKQEGIPIENQATNYQQLSDAHIHNYQQHIMIEKLYSLL